MLACLPPRVLDGRLALRILSAMLGVSEHLGRGPRARDKGHQTSLGFCVLRGEEDFLLSVSLSAAGGN